MELIVNGVETVVRYGPAYVIDDHLKKTGRDPLVQSHAILLLYKRSPLGSRNITTPSFGRNMLEPFSVEDNACWKC